MPRRTRPTSWAAWTLFAAAGLCLLAWAVSTRWTVFRMAQFGDSQGLKAGEVFVLWTTRPLRERLAQQMGEPLELSWGWHSAPRLVTMEWAPYPRVSRSGGRAQVTFPLWVPPLPCAALGLWLRHRDRRRFRIGCCAACGYDRRGLDASAPCPECGAVV